MRTHQYAQKKEASSSFYTSVPRPYEVQPSVQPPPMQAKSNEEGLAEHAERLRKFRGLGNSFIQMGPPRFDNDKTSSLQPKPWIQRKLTLGQPGDKYEQEADRVASQVVEQINAPASKENNLRQSIQREKDLAGEMQAKCFRAAIQRKQAIAGGEALPDLESAINSARGGGQPLNAGLQQSMGQAMGADFSGVRVHTDTQSDQLNQSIQARAFTTGQDVFFREGAYQPVSRGGQELIAHELTHVVQQTGGQLNHSQHQSVTTHNSYLNLNKGEFEVKEGASLEMPERIQRRMVILDTAADVGRYVVVANMRKRYPNETVTYLPNADLSTMALNETLYLLAHGSGKTVASLSPSELASSLISKGLLTGTKIEVRACHSGEMQEALGDKTFVDALAEEIWTQSQKTISVQVIGYAGTGVVQEQGSYAAKDPEKNTEQKRKVYSKIIKEGASEIKVAKEYIQKSLKEDKSISEIAEGVKQRTAKTFQKLYAHNLTVQKDTSQGKVSSSLVDYLRTMDPNWAENDSVLKGIREREKKEWSSSTPSYIV